MMKFKFVPPKVIRMFYPDVIWESRGGKVLLTFDDSPSSNSTELILKSLDSFGLKAVFFVQGNAVLGREKLIREIHNAGHTIGNHSFTHRNMKTIADDQVIEELKTVNDPVESITGEKLKYFRPPFGRFNRKVLKIAEELELKTVMWSLFTYDYDNNSAIVKFAIQKFLSSNSIVVFHDKDGNTKTALEGIENLVETTRLNNLEIGNPAECLSTYF